MNIMCIPYLYCIASQFMINLKEKVSEATEEGERVKLRLCYARVEVDKRYKVTLRWSSHLLSCQYSGTTLCFLKSLLV